MPKRRVKKRYIAAVIFLGPLAVGLVWAFGVAAGVIEPPPEPTAAEIAEADSVAAVRAEARALEAARRDSVRANAWRLEERHLLAYSYAEDAVKARLRAPATADFPGVFEGKKDHVTHVGDQVYRIRSWVDAQNGFGANVRTWWRAVVEQVAEDEFVVHTVALEE